MAKTARKRPETSDEPSKGDKSFITVNEKSLDPGLASLFASSLGPVKAPPKSRYQNVAKHLVENPSDEEGDDDPEEDNESLSSVSEQPEDEAETEEDADGANESDPSTTDPDDDESASERSQPGNEAVLAKIQDSILGRVQERSSKKRKRGEREEHVEDAYMQRIAREEARDKEKRKKQKTVVPEANRAKAQQEDEDSDEESFAIPKHESLMELNENEAHELEKAARTVFLGNVSNEAITSKSARKALDKHLSSFIADLADNKPAHKVESVRFRSTAFAGALPKRAAFVKKEVMDSTTKCTNAYAVYSTKLAAREAVKRLNGTVVLGRHLRVDSVAHPSKVDHRRCVFVGNLGFVDDERNLNTEEDGKKKKSKPPGDAEEGLWVHFAKAGKVESVRVVRDSKTRVGKGFAYVQFEDENAVEAALQFNEQKFPPLLPRKLRVVRARAQKRKGKQPGRTPVRVPSHSKGAYNAKTTDEQKSKQGRARAMLGKAGAFKLAESFVFEGHRASSKQGASGLKLGGKKKGPNGRKKRSAAWKASSGKR